MDPTQRKNDPPVERMTYTVDEAIHALGISRTTFYELIKTGELASLKVGDKRMVMREDVLTFLRSRRVGAVA